MGDNKGRSVLRGIVFKRDSYTCQDCGWKSENKRGKGLELHHIKSVVEYPELKLDPDNCNTLCVSCHKQTKSYSIKKAGDKKVAVKTDQLAEMVKGIIGSTEPITEEQAQQLMDLHSDEIETERIRMAKEKQEAEKAAQEKGEKPKHVGGRPTNYRPKMCIQAIQSMSTGQGWVETAGNLLTFKDNMLKWAENNAEFRFALKIGRTLYEIWWKNQGRMNMHNKNFNAVLWMMNMTNRLNWTRKTDQTETIKGEQTITHKHVIEQVKKRSEKELTEVLDILSRYNKGENRGAEATRDINATVH